MREGVSASSILLSPEACGAGCAHSLALGPSSGPAQRASGGGVLGASSATSFLNFPCSPPRFSSKILLLASDWADIFIRGYWLGGYFLSAVSDWADIYPGANASPVTSPRDLLQIDPGFLLWFHRLKILQFLWVNSKVLDRFNKKQTVPFY